MNYTGLRLSPCGVPIFVANAIQSPVDRRGWSEVIIIIIYTTYIAPYIWPVWPFIGAEEGPSKY